MQSIGWLLPFSIVFGLLCGVPLWFCLLLPFCVAGVKLAVSAHSLRDYEKSGYVYNENKLRKHLWLFAGILLALAYGLPAIGCGAANLAFDGAAFALDSSGCFECSKNRCAFLITARSIRTLLSQITSQMDQIKQSAKTTSEKAISADTSITSNKKGFEYLNDLFIKRHQKILWKSTTKIASICLFLVCGMLLALYLVPSIRPVINEQMMHWLPYFVFIMYMMNRGTGFTQALFMNCDHSLLTYSFYKQPKFILKLFQIRLREIMKINAVPALVIGTGLPLILYASGGTDQPLHYVVLFVSILCMSISFPSIT